MQGSSLAVPVRGYVPVRDWPWWKLPAGLRLYVAAAPVAVAVVIAYESALTRWSAYDGIRFLLLTGCGVVSVAFTSRSVFKPDGGITRYFATVWVLPVAVLLPPVYAAVAPIPLTAALHFFVRRGVVHRHVFTAASMSLPYAAVSAAFRMLPQSVTGTGAEWHVVPWTVAVIACEVLANRAQHLLIDGAIKMSEPRVNILSVDMSPRELKNDFLSMDLAVLITLAIALSPALVVFALPAVLFTRRFLEYPILVAQTRTDPKTGLLNAAAWDSEAATELSRAARFRHPLAVAMIDIDHFKVVNDTHGHLVGDRALKALAEVLTSQSRDYDRPGRFGGEEFVLLLPQTVMDDACRIADRLRARVEELAIPVSDASGAATFGITVSVGVSATARGERFELADLMAAADAAMYEAKNAGRNRVARAAPRHKTPVETAAA